MEDLLNINDLSVFYYTRKDIVKAVEGINLTMGVGKALGIIGESGSGKSTLALSIIRLIPPSGKIVGGEIHFRGVGNILGIDEHRMEKIRGRRIAMSFQDPATYLNPVLSVGEQIGEAIALNQNIDPHDIASRVIEIMELVDIHSSEKRFREYPHQMSGGMKQRILIAIALACNPDLYIADEPTTSLDVIVQRDILDLLLEIKRKTKFSMIVISHDLGVIAHTCNEVAVMYAGQLMELGDIDSLFRDAAHPYTETLLRSIPQIDAKQKRLPVIVGTVPDLAHKPPGCPFNPRCPYATWRCKQKRPALEQVGAEHYAACFKYE